MKNHSLKVEISLFLVVLFSLILPSFLTYLSADTGKLFTQWNFPVNQACLAFISFFLFLFYNDNNEKPHLLPFPVFLSVGFLFFTALIIKFFSVILKQVSPVSVKIPDSFTAWLFCILTFAFAAVSEEIIYRFYFVDKFYSLLKHIFKNENSQRPFVLYFCELTGCLLFAFAHLYLGWLAVLNAFVAHIVLRGAYKKNKCLFPCIISHFLYNIISLILL